jgi:DNA repair exonuclease SbcCD nuclease subunit
MKYAFVTDLHLIERDLEWQREGLAEVVRIVKEAGVDFVVIGGDLCGREVPHRPSAKERNALCSFVSDLRSTLPEDGEVFVLRGNHDQPEEFAFLNFLGDVSFIESPLRCDVGEMRPARIALLPWIDRSAGEALDDAAYTRHVRAEYERVLNERGPDFDVIFAHAAVSSAKVGSGQPATLTSDPLFEADFFARLSTTTLLGHYHEPQDLDVPHDALVAYGGALFFNEHGEAGARGFSIGDTETGEVTFYALNSPRKDVFVIDAKGSLDREPTKVVPHSSAKIVLDVTNENETEIKNAIGKARTRLMAAGYTAFAAKVNRARVVTERKGSREIAKSTSLAEKFEAWCNASDIVVDDGDVNVFSEIATSCSR